MAKKTVHKAKKFDSLVGRINNMLTPTKRMSISFSGSKYTVKTVSNQTILDGLTENETHYALHGVYEGVKLNAPKKRSK